MNIRVIWNRTAMMRVFMESLHMCSLGGTFWILRSNSHRILRSHWRVLVKVVIGAEEQGQGSAGSEGVGKILSLRQVLRSQCHPGYQVLQNKGQFLLLNYWCIMYFKVVKWQKEMWSLSKRTFHYYQSLSQRFFFNKTILSTHNSFY